MLSDGAEKVILVDPILPKDISAILKEQIEIYNSRIKPSTIIDSNRIQCYNNLEVIDNKWNNKIDYICSNYVLEHFKNLESFFTQIKRLLKLGGISLNKVDLSDHTYHILVKYPFIRKYIKEREIDYFRYSEKTFNFINNNKCYMNRIPLPVYINFAEKYALEIKELITRSNPKAAKPHKDIIKKNNVENSELLHTVNFTISLKNAQIQN